MTDRASIPRRGPTTRGRLRIYLGAGAGVGKTFALLTEGHLRAEHGSDVVIAYAETRGRPATARLLEGLEVVPRAAVPHRGGSFDLDAVLARNPDVALLDDLAHLNHPCSRDNARWQDVARLLDAGIDVISTVDVRHLDSLNDVVEAITGVPPRDTVPDAIVRAADEVELVGVTMQPLPNGGVSALQELALRWLAANLMVDARRCRDNDARSADKAGERFLVALSGHPNGEIVVRRAARLAARSGAELIAVHVGRRADSKDDEPAALAAQRRLVASIGGVYHQVIGDDIPATLLTLGRTMRATQLVLGGGHRSWLSPFRPRPAQVLGTRTGRGRPGGRSAAGSTDPVTGAAGVFIRRLTDDAPPRPRLTSRRHPRPRSDSCAKPSC